MSLLDHGDENVRASAARSLDYERALLARWNRTVSDVDQRRPAAADAQKTPANTIFDMAGGESEQDLPGRQVRAAGDPPSGDTAVNEAFDAANATLAFYREVFQRNSVDGAGYDLRSSVHFGQRYDNAFWTGDQMVYGDGGGGVFVAGGLTKALDVIGHELTHGVTQYTANLTYSGQSGALNESFSDVFGMLVKHYTQKIDAASADWLIGEGSVDPSLGRALRNMIAPGTAYDGDEQPADMDGYKNLPADDDPKNDNGGVHLNSGIPNRAFAETARAIGGNAWEAAGHIWYETLTGGQLHSDAQFADAAGLTIAAAGKLFGENSSQQQAVQNGWAAVKVTPAPAPASRA